MRKLSPTEDEQQCSYPLRNLTARLGEPHHRELQAREWNEFDVAGSAAEGAARARRSPITATRRYCRPVVLGQEITTAPQEVWEKSLPAEEADWQTLAWQQIPAAQRHAEWARHMGELGLAMEDFANDRVLDVGCGPTGIVYFLDAAARVGLDPMGDLYAEWNGYYGEPINLITSQAEHMPFHNESFDSVFCINCLDHTQDANLVVDEIARVLRPGGRLVLHVDLDSPLRRVHKRVKKNCRDLHPLSLRYEWLRGALTPSFEIERERRDPETFRATRTNMRYEAYWDGLMYRLTGSRTWMHHVWLTARRH